VLREAITAFKYSGRIDLDRPLGRLLAQRLRTAADPREFDLILPVPLHPQRLRERGYNQSLLLARVLSRQLQRPLAPRLLRRLRATPPQQGLNAALRQANLRQAFALSQPLRGEHLLLIDDVVTTTATARECSRVLLEGGAGAVTLAVLARAGRHG
jgi:ComF family protein